MTTAPKTILIADDDPDIVAQVDLVLSAEGFTTVTAESQKDAEARLEDVEPDLAVVDLMMENMDSGFVLSHQIKAKYPGTPVIILTAVTADTGMEFDATTKGEKQWIGADVMVDKPVRPEQLLHEVTRLLEASTKA
jgi:CheY-like chemotaxis protein